MSLGLDAGTQGEDYRFGDGYNFGTASLIFTWRIFDGGGDNARVHQARATEKQLVLRQEEIAQQIRLEVQQSFDRLTTRAIRWRRPQRASTPPAPPFASPAANATKA